MYSPKSLSVLFTFICLLKLHTSSFAQNPLIMDQFTADPSARVFEGKVYLYPSHDIECKEGQGNNGFCMPDYHVFSSANLTDWQDHGVIVDQNNVDWVDSSAFGMWAPDCIFNNEKYYFYFPAIPKDKSAFRRVGVAISDTPYGPFKPEKSYIEGVQGIDPNPFIDKDGQAYLYWGGGEKLYASKLKDNMVELASEPQVVTKLPKKYKEGSYVFERNGIYYFTFPNVISKLESLVYATGDNPLGPFTYQGVIMDETPGCWTNHHSIIEYEGQWYLFYHQNELSPETDKRRSIRADKLFFQEDGSIMKVSPTMRGIGITDATDKIQLDRYSEISSVGASISFLTTADRHKGWKVTLSNEKAWVRYNDVNFDKGGFELIETNAVTNSRNVLELRVDAQDGPLLGQMQIKKTQGMEIVKTKLKNKPTGIHDIFILLKTDQAVSIDWIRFK